MDNNIIGYVAASTSVLAFGTQFVHTIRSGTTAGLSFPRTILDSVSLVLWVVYATRIEDLPLLIATSFEFVTSLCVLIIRDRYKVWMFVKLETPYYPYKMVGPVKKNKLNVYHAYVFQFDKQGFCFSGRIHLYKGWIYSFSVNNYIE